MLRKHEALYIDGWKTDFVNPNSLLPSKNTSSIGMHVHLMNYCIVGNFGGTKILRIGKF